MKPIHYWRYTLRSAGNLNAVSARREHEGALIRVGQGYGCLHPWPELGDLPIDGQLRLLRDGGRSPLIEGALACAAHDAACRGEARSIFSGAIPESHWLVRPGEDPERVVAEGFTLAKIKGSPDRKGMRDTMERWTRAGLRIRLDCNETLAPGAFLPFWEGLSEELRASVDLVEDPEEWTREGWEALRCGGVRIAVDRDGENRLQSGDVAVVKPARPGKTLSPQTRCYVTSYMDHAIGQVWAAASAAAMATERDGGSLLRCGLLTHRCFEKDAFFERLECDGPRLLPPGGTGLGFDDLLESLPWKPLI